jgi:type IV pilus assembly protein PilB
MALSNAHSQTPTVAPPLGGLARKLVADKLLAEEQAREFQQRAVKSGQSFVALLVEAKAVAPLRVAEIASGDFGAALVDLNAIDIDPNLIKDLSEKLLRKTHTLPLYKRGKTLFVAVSDPTNLAALDEIKFATGFNTEAVVVEEDKLTKAIEATSQKISAASMDLGYADLDNIDISDASDRKSVV